MGKTQRHSNNNKRSLESSDVEQEVTGKIGVLLQQQRAVNHVATADATTGDEVVVGGVGGLMVVNMGETESEKHAAADELIQQKKETKVKDIVKRTAGAKTRKTVKAKAIKAATAEATTEATATTEGTEYCLENMSILQGKEAVSKENRIISDLLAATGGGGVDVAQISQVVEERKLKDGDIAVLESCGSEEKKRFIDKSTSTDDLPKLIADEQQQVKVQEEKQEEEKQQEKKRAEKQEDKEEGDEGKNNQQQEEGEEIENKMKSERKRNIKKVDDDIILTDDACMSLEKDKADVSSSSSDVTFKVDGRKQKKNRKTQKQPKKKVKKKKKS